MFNSWTVMYLIFVGVVAGFVARLLVPGRDAIGFWWTILLGTAGSFAGGFLAWALFGWDEDEGALQPGGVIFSIIGAVQPPEPQRGTRQVRRDIDRARCVIRRYARPGPTSTEHRCQSRDETADSAPHRHHPSPKFPTVAHLHPAI